MHTHTFYERLYKPVIAFADAWLVYLLLSWWWHFSLLLLNSHFNVFQTVTYQEHLQHHFLSCRSCKNLNIHARPPSIVGDRWKTSELIEFSATVNFIIVIPWIYTQVLPKFWQGTDQIFVIRQLYLSLGIVVSIDSDNGLLPARRQAITQTTADLLKTVHIGTTYSTILFRPQSDKHNVKPRT